MKDGPISKLLITKTGQRPTQYKKIVDTLLVLLADKNYQGLNDVIWNGIDQVKTYFMPTYLDATRWSTPTMWKLKPSTQILHQMQLVTGLRPRIVTLVQQTHIFTQISRRSYHQNLGRIRKIKSQEFSKFVVDKKVLLTIIFVQCNKAIKTKIILGANYTADCQAGRLIEFLDQLCTVCFTIDDGGL